ncbi:FAD-binding-3 domain-containing protein [Fusarium sp. LHS14.1]|nr:FAD-binding-3 domain-containing protein [Fusarium sp. LHS14.1]
MAVSNFKVIIVGGGPVGLVAAHVLYKAGIDFVVLERRENVILDLGAALVLAPHNMRVMHQLGLYDKLMEIGQELLDTKGFLLNGYQFKTSTELQLLKQNHGVGLVAFHRAQLVQVLYDNLPEDAKSKYFLDKRVTAIDASGDSSGEGVQVLCYDRSVYKGSIVLGADGVHSVTRKWMRDMALSQRPSRDWDPEEPFTSVYKCLWASFPRPSDPGANFETTSKDQSAMYLTGRDRGWILLYDKSEPTTALRSYSEKEVEEMAAKLAELPVNETLKVKDVVKERFTWGMSDLGEGILKHWSHGRIVPAGDACHKFTPNAGLGLNNGIQDIVVLCNGLHQAIADGKTDTANLVKVFERYQSDRAEAVEKDYKQSSLVTRLQTWASGLYYFLSRFVLSNNFVARFVARFATSPHIRKARVLDFVRATELPLGNVGWQYAIPQ